MSEFVRGGMATKAELEQVASGAIGGSWVDVIGSRSLGVWYVNNTGKPLVVNVAKTLCTGLTLLLDGEMAESFHEPGGSSTGASLIVPAGSSYMFGAFGDGTVQVWREFK